MLAPPPHAAASPGPRATPIYEMGLPSPASPSRDGEAGSRCELAEMLKVQVLKPKLPGFKSRTCFLTVTLASYLTSLSLGFLIYKMGNSDGTSPTGSMRWLD